MKSLFLVLLILYLAIFPSSSPTPIVEIIEEEIVIGHISVVTKVSPPAIKVLFTEFTDYHNLSPQTDHDPLLRPPCYCLA